MPTTTTKIRNQKNLTVRQFNRALEQCRNFVVTTHIYPEGDAIGSVLSMYSFLKRLGKKVRIICQDPIPHRWQALASSNWKLQRTVKSIRTPEAVVVLDVSSLDRIGTVNSIIGPETKIFNVDHHATSIFYGDYNLVNVSAASAGQLVWELISDRGLKPTAEEARLIYATLLTDTGWFQYNNTNTSVLKLASSLASTGFSVPKLNDGLLHTWSLDQLKLLSRILERVRTEFSSTVAWSFVEQNDLIELELSKTDVERAIDFLRFIRGVQFAFLITEVKLGQVTVSLRSSGRRTVHDIAKAFGGGGHRQAAGVSIQGTIDEAAHLILSAIARQSQIKVSA